MSDLKIRKIDFVFDETIPFQWLPSHPKFGLMCNAISMLAIAFEKFIVTSTTRALPRITDPVALEEAHAFLRQEAQHAKNHRRHIGCLIKQYPGLQETLDEAIASYDQLIATKSLEWQLAYTADLESTFTPIFKVMLDHEDELFRPGDERVSSLFLWHFCEEIEHRSSGLIVYDAVVPNPWYRVRVSRAVFRHVMAMYRLILAGFEKHVPESDRQAGYQDIAPERVNRQEVVSRLPLPESWRKRLGETPPSPFAPASNWEMLIFAFRLALSQKPNHKPEGEPLPPFAAVWFDHYDAGADVRAYYSSVLSAKVG
jgi:predicted metal-dependent hydrolase